MNDFADARWRDLLAVWICTAALLMAINLIRGDVLLSSLQLVSLLLGGALVALAMSYAKRRIDR